MPRRTKGVVLDTWAVIAYFEDEPAGRQVADIIADVHERGLPLMMSVVNIGEIWYLFARNLSETGGDQIISELIQLGVVFVDVDWPLAREAARFKSKHRMSYADCFAAALAKQKKAELVTGDREFRQVEREVRIVWLPKQQGSP